MQPIVTKISGTRPPKRPRSRPHYSALLLAFVAGQAWPQSTTRASIGAGGTEGNFDSQLPAMSADARYVAFESLASNLVSGDTNAQSDIFVHDRLTGSLERISVSSSGDQANGESVQPAISADGSCVVFASLASNLVAGDSNNRRDVFLHDRASGSTILLSTGLGGQPSNHDSDSPSVSADGQLVAFQSQASNLVANDTNGFYDVFVYDRLAGTLERASLHSSGAQGNGNSTAPDISADGLALAFESFASNLIDADSNGMIDVFVRNLQAQSTQRVSLHSNGTQGDAHSFFPAISGDGGVVAFASPATNLVEGDNNGQIDVFVHVLASSTTSLVSKSSSGTQSNGECGSASISADGRWVAFMSIGDSLVGGDSNARWDCFLHERIQGFTERVSVSSAGEQSEFGGTSPVLSAAGQAIAFESFSSDLVDDDTNFRSDVFVRQRIPEVGTKYCSASANSSGAPAELSASGSASTGASQLDLQAAPVPNQAGVIFHGAAQSQTPFGNGFLCVTGNIVRGSLIQANANQASYRYDNSDARHSLNNFVGSTRYFQYWFRDPQGGGSFFNLSNALAIAVQP